ncbi:hypothetical protein EJB05_21822, partial [Eragrostis curvula]
MEEVGKSTDPSPAAASAASVSSVLGNDDLLRLILLRLEFPTSLVRAAAVSKRWLRHASDPAFLRAFRRLHPPRVLGCYAVTDAYPIRFVPVPLPPELASVVRRGSFRLVGDVSKNFDCGHGRLLFFDTFRDNPYGMCRPLHCDRGLTALPLPPFPGHPLDPEMFFHPFPAEAEGVLLDHGILLSEDDVDDLSCNPGENGIRVHVREIRHIRSAGTSDIHGFHFACIWQGLHVY